VQERLAIRGGLVVDGTGGPPRRADVLVADGRIAAVGDVPPNVAAAVIDARDRVVAPGFVDVHSHADFTVLAFPSAESAILQGVTTVVVGNCGGGVAPAHPQHDVRRVAFGYQPDWGLDISWSSYPEYLDRLQGLAVNVAALVPHGAVRNAVLGLAPRPATSAELATMTHLVAEALDAGAVGLSSGLEYQPGCYADVDELASLAAAVAVRGGVYATHMRDRAERFADATDEAIAVARRTGARLQLSHVAPRPHAPRDQVARAFAAIEGARRDGVAVWVDTFPETWGPGLLGDLFPRELMQGTAHEILGRLGDPAARRRIDEHFAAADSFLVRAAGYERIFLAASPVRPELTGRSLPDLAREAGTSVAGWCTDALLEAGPRLTSIAIRHVYATEDDLRDVLRLPYCSIGSDGVVTSGEGRDCRYPWNASTYGYVPRTLCHYVVEEGLLSIEDAVRRLTALPAEAIGLADRGVLAPGRAADVVVLDLAQVRDNTRPDDMARYADGVEHVLVNGIAVVSDGRPTAARPGRAVTGQ
jgi:N-acyl-D-amino-acid deacylase